MKVILTGYTGFIGREVLAQCLENKSITSIIALSRRPLTPASETATHSSKLKVVIMQNFTSYPESVLAELADAEACIWAMGTFSGDPAIDIEAPLAFCTAMRKTLSETLGHQKFRYVHLGGAVTERDQEKQLWYYQTARRIRGMGEIRVTEFAHQPENEKCWEICIVKPGSVMAKDGYGIMGWVLGSSLAVRVDELAAAMVDSAVNGSEEEVVQNRELVARGRELLTMTV